MDMQSILPTTSTDTDTHTPARPCTHAGCSTSQCLPPAAASTGFACLFMAGVLSEKQSSQHHRRKNSITDTKIANYIKLVKSGTQRVRAPGLPPSVSPDCKYVKKMDMSTQGFATTHKSSSMCQHTIACTNAQAHTAWAHCEHTPTQKGIKQNANTQNANTQNATTTPLCNSGRDSGV